MKFVTGRRVQSRKLSTAEYKRLEMADEREEIGEVNQIFCRTIQS